MFSNHWAAPRQEHSYQPHHTAGPLSPQSCYLSIRQQPKEALVTLQGKEKVRKPVDPPPILELSVNSRTEPDQQFLQNPYLFVCATLYKADKDEPVDLSTEKSLAGTLVSSLHRLKDVSNKDGGFFVFGDMSIKVQGTYRLCFTLYEFQPDALQAQHLGSIISDKFGVMSAKDFKGLEESTYLSRAFSDQGVRLRLRKEPRSTLHKRSYPLDPAPVSNAALRPNVEYQPTKKIRPEYPATLNLTTSAGNMPYNMGTAINLPYTLGSANSLYPHGAVYPQYGHRDTASSSVDHSGFMSQYPTSDTQYLE